MAARCEHDPERVAPYGLYQVLAVIVILVAVLVMSVFKPSGWGPIPGYVLTAASAVLLVVLYRLIYKRW